MYWKCTPDETQGSALEDVAVSWKLVSNQVADEPRFQAVFTLTNKSNATLEGDDWTLYFSQTPRAILQGSVRGPADIQRINGDLYQLQPDSSFRLSPGDSLTITYEGEAWLIKETDAPLGLFFVKMEKQGEGKTIRVAKYTIWPFEEPEQYSRHKNDKTPYPDPAYLYEQNAKLKKLDRRALPPVVPTPRKYTSLGGDYSIDQNTAIYFPASLENEAGFLQESLSGMLSQPPQLMKEAQAPPAGGNGIVMEVNPGLPETSVEAYHLNIGEKVVTISGKTTTGVFYGIQSLLALITPDQWGSKSASLSIPRYNIQDAPRFGYRGMHLDIARNYNDLKAIKKLVDGMAFYKMNKLHLHLTDDEGWRLEIPGLPELTEVGAQRGYTPDESDRLAPAYGSGADGSQGHGSGYLTRAEFIELLQYATRRHIEVIPELNVPGHARAAIKAMEARYRKMAVDNDQEVAAEFRLADPGDQSEYRSVQNYPDNVVCVCCEGTYRFYEKVVDEVRAMFTEAGAPLTTIHTGGDEVPAGVWTASPECGDLIRENSDLNSVADLPTYFFGRIQSILEERGLKAAGWEEVAMLKTDNGWIPNPAFIGKDVIPYVWNNLWGNQDLGNRLANAGYPVVLCNVTNLYFDLAYSKDPLEPGLYWGGFIDTRKAFDLRPFDVLHSTEEDPMGNRFDPEKDYAQMERLRPNAQSNILGIQGELWSETIKGPRMLEYYYFPKMLGLAERAWGAPLTRPDSDTEWEVFANELGQRELDRLNYLSDGYNYRLPPPGAKLVAGKIAANSAYPGLIIRYTTDGREPGKDDPVYSEPVEADSLVCLKTFDPMGRSSRMVCLRK